LQEEITIKEHLVIELEQHEKRLANMRKDYETKMAELLSRITATESERDKALNDLQSRGKSKETEEKIRKVKEDYEAKISALRNDHKKLVQVENEHRKLQRQQKKQQEELQKYMRELLDMKRNKVSVVDRGLFCTQLISCSSGGADAEAEGGEQEGS